eukprot:3210489-Amphidinium_carterae.1
MESLYGPEHPEVAIALNNLGNAYGKLGDSTKERDYQERALRIFESHYGSEHSKVAIMLNNLAATSAKLGDLPLAHEQVTAASQACLANLRGQQLGCRAPPCT